MKRRQQAGPLLRAVAIISAVGIITTGVTFAALTSQQAVLAGNSIETATADLRVSTNSTTYSNSLSGFDFPNVIPGGSAVPVAGNAFYLKNFGGTTLALKLAVPSAIANPNNADLSKVNVILITVGSGLAAQSFSLASLMEGSTNGGVSVNGNLAAGAAQQYKVQVSMASDAVSGASASLSNIDLAFSGTAVSQ